MMKYHGLLILLFSGLLVGCVRQQQEVVPTPAVKTDTEQIKKPIGGERDEFGCLGPAGYQFIEEVGACGRSWELDENQRQAAALAVATLGFEPGMTVIGVVEAECGGCFEVVVELRPNRWLVRVEDGEVVDRSLTSEECEDLGGTVVNVTGGGICGVGEYNVGEVIGLMSKNYCCKGGNHEIKKTRRLWKI